MDTARRTPTGEIIHALTTWTQITAEPSLREHYRARAGNLTCPGCDQMEWFISWPQEFYPIDCTDSHGFVDPTLIRAAQRGAKVEVQGRVPDGTWWLTINDRTPGITPLTRANAGSGKRS